MRASSRRDAWGFGVALVLAVVLTVVLWPFTVARWVGLAVVLVCAGLLVNRAWVAASVAWFDRLNNSGTKWDQMLIVTVRQPKGPPPVDVVEACDEVCLDLLVETGLGTYDVQSDVVRGEDSVRLYANSSALLDDVAAALVAQIGRPKATFLIERG